LRPQRRGEAALEVLLIELGIRDAAAIERTPGKIDWAIAANLNLAPSMLNRATSFSINLN
jgi:hypothetical protein